MNALLKEHFGYDTFRPMQEGVIRNILDKKDTMVLMPTGGGKSICYQLPALKFEGVTLVISPLISLMKDQVDALQAKHINAEFINSSLGVDELADIQFRALAGQIKLLYIAPERLRLTSFETFLQSINISLIAIDEAHCISEWGHDFRPEYQSLKSLKTNFPGVPIVALTATATDKVKQDIKKYLALEDPKIFTSSFDRKNLKLIVRRKKDTFGKIVKILEEQDGPAIIYCFSRREVEKIADDLLEEGFEALPYHAGLPAETRKKHQELFIQGKIDIIVATIAFGMGIDKPDVRLIIHHTFPKTLEGYYQEIGRAGRDGLPSECILFYSSGDRRKHGFFIDKIADDESQHQQRNKMRKVMDYCEFQVCRRKKILEYFGETYTEPKCNNCDICLNEN